MTQKNDFMHPAAKMYAQEVKDGKLDRREFLSRATALGLTTVAAYGLLGLDTPAQAGGHAKKGGTIRMQMDVKAFKDPRTHDWTQISIISAGWLEYLVEYNSDGSFEPMLLTSWEANANATQYTLKVREGVKWNNGEDFTSEDVARVISDWCDKAVEGNSMAGRMATLVDEATGKALEGAIEVVDSHTVKLNLPASDISIIAGMADYPAAVYHKDTNFDDMLTNAVGTGPYLPESMEVGVKAVLVRNDDHWWNKGNGAWAERVEFIDYGQDPSAWVAAAEADEVDVLYSVDGDFIDIMGAMDGWVQNEVVTAATIVIRPNQLAEVDGKKPYADKRVRQAIAMAVDNNVLLELGYEGRGLVAANHHVGPSHPEYVDIGLPKHDPAGAKALLDEAGMGDFEMEILSIDDAWRKNTTDAVAAQLRDAGFNVKRTVLPGSTFWNDWVKYPFSSTNWNHRPLGVQIWALAYRSGEAWNEFGYANPEFDALLTEALATADVEKRKVLMEKGEKILQDDAVTIQPYWRSLYNHAKDNIAGGEHHISFEIDPAMLAWKA